MMQAITLKKIGNKGSQMGHTKKVFKKKKKNTKHVFNVAVKVISSQVEK
jgi:hypothetical protein